MLLGTFVVLGRDVQQVPGVWFCPTQPGTGQRLQQQQQQWRRQTAGCSCNVSCSCLPSCDRMQQRMHVGKHAYKHMQQVELYHSVTPQPPVAAQSRSCGQFDQQLRVGTNPAWCSLHWLLISSAAFLFCSPCCATPTPAHQLTPRRHACTVKTGEYGCGGGCSGLFK